MRDVPYMSDEDLALIRRRMIALREGTGDMTREEAIEWLCAEIDDALNEALIYGTLGLQNYGLLNDPMLAGGPFVGRCDLHSVIWKEGGGCGLCADVILIDGPERERKAIVFRRLHNSPGIVRPEDDWR
jgi:hypothetical protein